MENPLVSIIVPIYNTEKYLSKCLDSIISQDYQNLEIILVDDGSTDNCPKIIDSYAAKDSRIKVMHQKNAGLSAARNTGLKNIHGNFVTFIDSDDTVKKTIIKKLTTVALKNNAEIAVCSFLEKYDNNKTHNFNDKKYPSKVMDTKTALKSMLKEEGFMLSATMKLFHKSTLDHIEFPQNKLHEDVGTTYKFIMNASKIVFIPDAEYIYFQRNSSIAHQQFDDRKLDLIELTDQMCDDIELKFPELENVIKERKVRARFSILRQIPSHYPQTSQILKYLKAHQNDILKNPEASPKDKIAIRLAFINPNIFKLAYKLSKC